MPTNKSPAPVDTGQAAPAPVGPLDKSPAPVPQGTSTGVYPSATGSNLPQVTSPKKVAISSKVTDETILPVTEQAVDVANTVQVNTNVSTTPPRYVNVYGNGTLVVQAASTFNFTGNGVTVTSGNSSGSAQIAITGGGGNAVIDWNNIGNNILPSSTNTYDIGSGSNRWATLYTVSVGATGDINAGGNISGNYILGNGSQLTGISAAGSSNKIFNGSSYANIATANGNFVINAGNIGSWTFGTDGTLTLPNNAVIKDTAGNAVAIGVIAGQSTQGASSVAIGNSAGQTSQGIVAVAVGSRAGETSQGAGAVAVGSIAGFQNQGEAAVAVGTQTGVTSQGVTAVAIGYSTGYISQGTNAVAIGSQTGQTSQGNNAVAIGGSAGSYKQGEFSVAIGRDAGIGGEYTATYVSGAYPTGTTLVVNSTTGIAPGMFISGNGFVTDQTVVTVTNSTTLQISASADSAPSGTLTFYGYQGTQAVAVGFFAGNTHQGNAAVAIGVAAGSTNQGEDSVAIGNFAGGNFQGTDSVAVGHYAGKESQLYYSTAIGAYAGSLNQNFGATALGRGAGYINQGTSAVAVGVGAGTNYQGGQTVAVGSAAGGNSQGQSAVAVGFYAGFEHQGVGAIAIGISSGYDTQGQNSIAIGTNAGYTAQGNNSIIINATAANLNQTTANTFTVAPVRNDVANIGQVLFYNATSKEITYGNTISVAGNITGGNALFSGNLTVNGNITYINSNVVTINDLAINLANNAANITQINGGGIELGPQGTPYVTFLYNNSANTFTSNVGLSAVANISGGNVLTAGLISATANITGGNITTAGIMSSTGNVTGGNIISLGVVSAVGNLYTANAVTYSDTSNILGWWWSNSVSISQETNSTDVQFNSSGNTMYIVGTTGRAVYQYSLSTPWAANTATYASLSANVSAQAASPRSISFNSSGNTMFVLDQTTRAVYQYSISNTSNIATAAYASLSANISAQETTTPEGMTFSPDGANMYIVGTTLDTIYQYSISNTANIATATYASKSLAITTQEGSATGLSFNATGNVLYLIGTSARVVYQYNLGTPYDISTGSYSGNNLYVGYQDSAPHGIYVNLANNAVYINGLTNDRVYQYDTGNSTIVNSNSLAVTGYAHFSGNAQLANVYMPYNSTLSAAGSVNLGGTTFSSGITAAASTSSFVIGTGLTTGTFTIGGTAQTSNINIGRSANTSALVFGNGAVLSGNVKTIDIASNGLANSVSNVTIFGNVSGNSTLTVGALTGNTTVSYTANATVAIANVGASALSVAGNITGGNILTAGIMSSTGNATHGNIITAGLITATGNISGGNLTITGNTATITTANYSVGYLNIPQVSLAANTTTALTDSGKHYYSTSASNLALTIANNTSVVWPVGTAISVVNRGTANITVAGDTGVSLYLAGNSTAGNRVVTTYGIATVMNVAANIWMISGTVV